MRVLLADDQAEVRSALKLLLEQDSEIAVVGEAADADALLAVTQATEPDIVLLDWELPGHRVVQVLPKLRACAPKAKVIALSGRLEARRAALAAGADAFVSKGDPPERLLAALHAAGSNG